MSIIEGLHNSVVWIGGVPLLILVPIVAEVSLCPPPLWSIPNHMKHFVCSADLQPISSCLGSCFAYSLPSISVLERTLRKLVRLCQVPTTADWMRLVSSEALHEVWQCYLGPFVC